MTPLMEVTDLRFSYGDAPVLDGISFTVGRRELLGVIGPNSAGKTTLLRLLSRVLDPQEGAIHLTGQPLARLSRGELARTIAVVPQEVTLAFPFTAREFVLMGRYPHGRGRFFESADDVAAAAEALARVGVMELAGALMPALSGGERQLVVVARALAQGPALLLMDEPSAHLDLRHQVELARLVRQLNHELGTTVVLVSHDLNLAAEVCDRLLLLARGRVARLGTPAEVLDAALLEDVYGCRVSVEANPASGRPRVQVRWLDDGALARSPAATRAEQMR